MNIGFIKEVFTNMPHAIIIKTAHGVSTKSITEYGKSIAQSININAKSIDEQLPPGFVFSGFTESQDSFSNVVGENLSKAIDEVVEKTAIYSVKKFSERKLVIQEKNNSSLVASKIPNGIHPMERNKVIKFKAMAFRSIGKKARIGQKLRSRHVSVDQFSRSIKPNSKSIFSEIIIDSIKSKYGASALRKTLSSGQVTAPGGQSRRAMRRSRSLAPVNNSVKHANVATRINVAVAKAGF